MPQSRTRALFGLADRMAVLVLEGPVRYTAAQALRAFVDGPLAHADVDTVVVDLRRATFIDSTGMGLVARVGKSTLERHGRRAVLVCQDNDVAVALRAATFDLLCAMVEEPPYDAQPALEEVSLPQADAAEGQALGRVILEAHRDLSVLSEHNRDEYARVIAALEAELPRGSSS